MAILKGALIAFTPSFIGAMPQIISFQINPETIAHHWESGAAGGGEPGEGGMRAYYDPLAVAGAPGESFAFTLMLDANDEIADAALHPGAAATAQELGVSGRLAALEMLQYPISPLGTLVGQVSSALKLGGVGAALAGSVSASVPASEIPLVLFVWGDKRILPVRVAQLEITEKLYDQALNPIQAEAQISLAVLTPDELVAIQGPTRVIAGAAYAYTLGQRQLQAATGVRATISAVLGMSPIAL